MKKILILIALVTLCSCRPKRLGCGPNRRCEAKTEINSQNDAAQKRRCHKSIESVIPNLFRNLKFIDF